MGLQVGLVAKHIKVILTDGNDFNINYSAVMAYQFQNQSPEKVLIFVIVLTPKMRTFSGNCF